MKQFLRYQVSGTVFIFWLTIFYYGTCADDMKTLITYVLGDLTAIKSFVGIFSALPLGVIIHQMSVILKNCIVAKLWREFDDFPDIIFLSNIDKNESKKYIFEKISNLNSFYYVRVDNGFISPMLAYLFVYFGMGLEIKAIWLIAAFSIGFILLIYIHRIKNEIQVYKKILTST